MKLQEFSLGIQRHFLTCTMHLKTQLANHATTTLKCRYGVKVPHVNDTKFKWLEKQRRAIWPLQPFKEWTFRRQKNYYALFWAIWPFPP